MGIAILWIFVLHIFPYETIYKFDIFRVAASIGYVGVDIFLFVSGFGLYFGYAKYSSKYHFYKKRFFRIVPTFVFFIILSMIATQNWGWDTFLSMFFNIGWYFPKSHLPEYNWYLTAIMLFYLFFPYYIKYFHENPFRSTVVITVISLWITFTLAFAGSINTAIMTTRLPIFCIGVYMSYLLKHYAEPIDCKYGILVSLVLLMAFLLFLKLPIDPDFQYTLIWVYGFYWIPFIMIVPGLLILIVSFLNFISIRIPLIIKLLNFFGTISLEIFLIHENIPLKNYLSQKSHSQTMFFGSMFLISVVGGWCVHKLFSKICK